MRLAYSWPMRWNTRSAPVRSTRVVMPGNFASNDLAIFSATGRSIDVYQTTLPSRRAASTSCGVICEGSGGAARIGDANAVAANAPVLSRSLRLESLRGIAFLPVRLAAALLWRGPKSYYPGNARQRSNGIRNHT